MKVKVVSVFRDMLTGQLYNPGEVIEIEDDDRVEDLVSRKLAEPIKEKKEAKVAELDEDATAKLKEAMNVEV